MRTPLVLVLFLVAACTTTSNSRFGDGGGLDGGAVGDSGPSFGDEGGLPGGGYCSGDLRSILDSQGNVVETCANDQGCAGGKCIAACDAAGASKGSIGCNFRVTTPPLYYGTSSGLVGQGCFAVFVANAWSRDAKISLSRQGQSFDATKFGRIAGSGSPQAWATVPSNGVPPGKVAVLFLSHQANSKGPLGDSMACPVAPAYAASTTPLDASGTLATAKSYGFLIESDTPVTSYDIMPFGGASSYTPSAQLLLPTTAWGTNFVAAIAPVTNNGYAMYGTNQWMHVLASADGTEVSVAPTQSLPGGVGFPAGAKNSVTKYTLNAGDFIQWQNVGDVTGTVLNSNKPIAVMGGNALFAWSTKTSLLGDCCAEATHQSSPPVTALGSEYAPSPIRTRSGVAESIGYRIVGAVDGTKLTYDPPISGAPASLSVGSSGIFETTSAFTVKSQDNAHPFFLAQIISGGATENLGDPEYVNVLPPAQFLSQYIFFTDPTYTDTHLALVRVKGAKGFEDVEVGCAGKVTGWKSVGTGGTYEYATLALTSSGSGVGSCANGPQSAKSKAPFGVVVWGFSQAASYGYPAGGNAAGINQVFVEPVPR